MNYIILNDIQDGELDDYLSYADDFVELIGLNNFIIIR